MTSPKEFMIIWQLKSTTMIVREALDSMYAVQEPGIPSDDTLYSRRRLYAQLLRIRAELLFQKMNKNQKISDQDYQVISCLQMVPVPLIECPCVPALGTYILRSEHKLPRFLTDVSGIALKAVTTLDGGTDFSQTSWESKVYSAGRKYTSKASDYYIKNNYLYITNPKTPEMVTLVGLFEDPLEIYSYPSACCADNAPDCIPNMDREFPIDRATFNAIIELVKKEVLEIKQAGNPQDTVNNSMSDASTIR